MLFLVKAKGSVPAGKTAVLVVYAQDQAIAQQQIRDLGLINHHREWDFQPISLHAGKVFQVMYKQVAGEVMPAGSAPAAAPAEPAVNHTKGIVGTFDIADEF